MKACQMCDKYISNVTRTANKFHQRNIIKSTVDSTNFIDLLRKNILFSIRNNNVVGIAPFQYENIDDVAIKYEYTWS